MSLLWEITRKKVKLQLEQQINKNRPLYSSQHKFRLGRSMLSNFLAYDSFLADLFIRNEPFGIISFDFKCASIIHHCNGLQVF